MRTLLKTTNAHACQVSELHSLRHLRIVLWYFKMVRKTIEPIYPKRTILNANVAKNLHFCIILPEKCTKI